MEKEQNNQIKFLFLAIILLTAVIMLAVLCVNYFSRQKENAPQQNQSGTDFFKDVKVVSVYDGDTFKINLNCKEDVFCKNISVRVKGIDCPEMKGKTPKEKELAKQAKQFTLDFLTSGGVDLENCSRDKYFRLNCDVRKNGADLAQSLLETGLAYPYDGGTKQADAWEEEPEPAD